MTDDFRLFDDDDGAPLDADVALITAYLARELSPMQVLAVEERLLSDAEFRDAMQPLIDAWSAPVASLAGSATRPTPLTAQEKSLSWDRFSKLDSGADSIAPTTTRRIPMKRVAAIVGLTALPVLSFAQAVTYAARNENAPMHAIAVRLVAAFSPQPAVRDSADEPLVVRDVPIGTVLTPTPTQIQRAPLTVTEALPMPSNPDRAGVMALVKQHQPGVVRGDTAVEYVLLVLDASNRYVWSTIGSGNLLIDVGGDTRSPAERKEESRVYMKELAGFSADTSLRSKKSEISPLEKTKPPYAIAATDDPAIAAEMFSRSAKALMAPEVKPKIRGDNPDTTAEATAKAGTTYKAGWKFTVFGATPLNQAAGLQEPGNGESGIQGIKSSSVARADAYVFLKGELGPPTLKVVVVQLTPGTNWRRGY